ncbi:MAG: hypothetical protein WD042_15160 [Phycisphaeraceae bacterium]
MKLCVCAVAVSAAIVWAGCVLVVGLINLAYPTYGTAFLTLCSSIYPGYHAQSTAASVLVGTGYAFVDALVCGAVFALVHNLIARRCGCGKCGQAPKEAAK